MATLTIITIGTLFVGVILYSVYQITHIHNKPNTH